MTRKRQPQKSADRAFQSEVRESTQALIQEPPGTCEGQEEGKLASVWTHGWWELMADLSAQAGTVGPCQSSGRVQISLFKEPSITLPSSSQSGKNTFWEITHSAVLSPKAIAIKSRGRICRQLLLGITKLYILFCMSLKLMQNFMNISWLPPTFLGTILYCS